MAKKQKQELRIEPVDKGYIVHHSHNYDSPGKYQAPTKHLFTDAKSMLAHVAKSTTNKAPKSFKDALKNLKSSK